MTTCEVARSKNSVRASRWRIGHSQKNLARSMARLVVAAMMTPVLLNAITLFASVLFGIPETDRIVGAAQASIAL